MTTRRSHPFDRFGWVASLVFACVAGGCASEYSREHTYEDGWRLARVEKIGGDFEAPLRLVDDCRAVAPSSVKRMPRYAELRFIERLHLRRRIVALPKDLTVSVGEKVYVNVQDCGIPLALGRSHEKSGE
jgi:hypothetical protein